MHALDCTCKHAQNDVRFGVANSKEKQYKKEKRIYLKSSPQPSQITVEGTFEPL